MTHGNDDSPEADDVTDLLGATLGRVAREWRPLLGVAIARMAGERYRKWAAMPGGERYRSRLLACANRQEEIARAVDALYADASLIEREILTRNSDLADIDRGAFADRPLAEQFLIQARWARLSAAAWRAFAQEERDAARNRAFRGCAELEEMNALVLEATISAPPTSNPGNPGGSCFGVAAETSARTVNADGPADDSSSGAPFSTRHDLQLGRRLFHLANGVSIATAYALLFTHEQVVRVFGAIACIVYIVDRIRIAYPDVVARRAPWVNRIFLRAEEQVREAAMTPFAIAVLLTILTVPKLAAIIAVYTLAIGDPLAAVVGILYGRRRITHNRSLEGSLAFFAATVTIAVLVLRWGTLAAPSSIAAASAAIAVAATACEMLPLRIDDNLTIPIFVGFASWAFAALCGIPLT